MNMVRYLIGLMVIGHCINIQPACVQVGKAQAEKSSQEKKKTAVARRTPALDPLLDVLPIPDLQRLVREYWIQPELYMPALYKMSDIRCASEVRDVAVTADNSVIINADTVQLWKKNRLVKELSDKKAGAMAVGPDGTVVALIDDVICVWKDGVAKGSVPNDFGGEYIKFIADGEVVVIDNHIGMHIYNANTLQKIDQMWRSFPGKAIRIVDFKERLFVILEKDNKKQLFKFEEHLFCVDSNKNIIITNHARVSILCKQGKEIACLDHEQKEDQAYQSFLSIQVPVSTLPVKVTALLVQPDGTIITGTNKGKVFAWKPDGTCIGEFSVGEEKLLCEVVALKDLLDGSLLVAISDGMIKIFKDQTCLSSLHINDRISLLGHAASGAIVHCDNSVQAPVGRGMRIDILTPGQKLLSKLSQLTFEQLEVLRKMLVDLSALWNKQSHLPLSQKAMVLDAKHAATFALLPKAIRSNLNRFFNTNFAQEIPKQLEEQLKQQEALRLKLQQEAAELEEAEKQRAQQEAENKKSCCIQ